VRWTSNQQLEDKSRDAFRNLAHSRGWIVRDKAPDVGIDMEVEIVEGQDVVSKVLWIQIKATESVKHLHEGIPFPIETKHLEYYESCQLPVIILLWSKPENSFYYLFAQRFIQEKLSAEDSQWRKKTTKTILFAADSKLENIDQLKTVATDGYLYIAQRQLNIKTEAGSAVYWLDGIPKSDDEELKQETLKVLQFMEKEKYNNAITTSEHILRTCTISPTQKMAILINLGNAYHSLGQNNKALTHYNEVLELTKKVNEKEALDGKSVALGNIGLIYRARGDLDNALKHHQDALKIDQEIGYKQGEASDLGNIGLIYRARGDLDNALKYFTDALKILDKFNLVYGRDIIQNALSSIIKDTRLRQSRF
jgi:tetratricopeptide (TPR) repeat protein